MKNGSALCVSCGREAKEEKVESILTTEKSDGTTIDNLDQKLRDLTIELQSEKDFEKQKQILHTMNEIIAIKAKLGAL
jgi:UPF0148 protein